MAFILAIDTAIDVCSVSLFNNDQLVAIRTSEEKNMHAQLVTQFIHQVLEEATLTTQQLDAIALSEGPGSYTGMRIGTSVAKGMCYALDIPLIAVSTLQIMAAAAIKPEHDDDSLYMPMIDARRNEVYTALFNKQLEVLVNVSPLIINDRSDVEQFTGKRSEKIYYFGNGAMKNFELLEGNGYQNINLFSHNSSSMATLAFEKYSSGSFEDIAYFEPKYLKIFQQVLN